MYINKCRQKKPTIAGKVLTQKLKGVFKTKVFKGAYIYDIQETKKNADKQQYAENKEEKDEKSISVKLLWHTFCLLTCRQT